MLPVYFYKRVKQVDLRSLHLSQKIDLAEFIFCGQSPVTTKDTSKD